MTDSVPFEATVRALREQQQLTQAALSVRAGLHVSEIGRIERGDRDPRLTTIVAVASGLGMTAEDLVRRAYSGR